MAAQTKAAAPCLTRVEMQGAVAYFLPGVLTELSAKCTAEAEGNTYLRSGLPVLIDRLKAGREAAWPQARAAFQKLASEGGKIPAFANMPDDALRPLIDQGVTQEISLKMSKTSCGDANDVLEALSPLAPEQAVNLVATILSVAARNDKSLRSCPRGI